MPDNRQSVDERLIDLTQLKLISRGNRQFIEKMLFLFVDMVPKSILNMNNSFEQSNWHKLSELAHSLKPTIDTLSIASLKSPIRKLEKSARNGKDKNEIRELTTIVVYHLQVALAEAKEILHKMK